ncbi:sugar ABC transporter ATP-binding protein [Clostridium transplantifaecale]|uniref:sugar ABC transporter ATP-binding protein n=1 Tax=Clostridium transplantifaecale TaxID=2479838 RepID=UPI000F63B87C|nr:sugar ABC transporter ATP-binding protein [Clostridium transplantifaecale]
MGETKLLQMQNITKAFASNVVLTGVNLSVGEGEVVAILGENGAGKSTLIKILGGIYKADSGEIHINGELKNIHSAAVAGANGIRIIHQEIILVPARTIAANVFMGRELKDKFGLVDAKRMEQETQKVIDDLHLNLRAEQLVEDLSIGMQQLVEIIKAVSAEARIVVMDEPTSSLSQGEVETLFDIIRLLKKKGVGIIYISHRLEELFAITDRIVVLRDGKMIGDVPTPEADKDELIKMMVGRELSSYYTRNKHEIKGISLEVKGLEHEKYFKDVNFHARYGEIVGFAGLVGARRTELMKTIFGAYQKSGGEIFLDGKKLEIRRPQDAIDNGIVYVSEDRRDEGLILKNDVKFNMGLVCLSDFIKGVGVKQADWDKMVEDYRKKFSIKITSAKQLAGNLSGGNQQKVVLSKWLAKNPKVIILDEPTRGIDVGSKAEIYAIIDELAANGVSIIMVSSELPEIINMCNRCYVMCEGKITGELSEEEFSQESMMTYATNRE